MKYNVHLTGPVKCDLQNVSRYISVELKNRTAARKLMLDTREAIRSLREQPFRHALVEDGFLASRGIRSFPVHNYLVFYVAREEGRKVTVLRFLYGSRDWAAILKDEAEPE
ncbi:MAG: type II toxin-antitoxin system RelE/ParE family toxin [Peptococcaceae bacterium]|jgi:toxin ParE1/3/4|nr:type II toxin-antitoxin system RelE/ParE family toxin [Peptococcaceae bacterium]